MNPAQQPKNLNLIQQLEKEQVAKLSAGKEIPDFEPGDTLLVNVKVVEGERSRVQAYEGVCIGRSGGGLNENFTVRKISYGEGVERVFPLFADDRLDQGGAPRQVRARSSITCADAAASRPHRRKQDRRGDAHPEASQ
jgi:ribosomal protein L19